jgi:hypothetical protein
MQKANIKKFSILGLVLIAASAVTAAVIPSSKDDNKKADVFSLTQTEGVGVSSFSCTATAEATAACGGEERSTLGQSNSTSLGNVSDGVTE